MPFVASVKEEKDFWRKCLLEMKAGHEIADGRKKYHSENRYVNTKQK